MTRPLDTTLPLLGALAAGFGLISLAQAQTATTPAADTPPATEATQQMPVVKARASAVRSGKDSVQAVTTQIGKGTQELRDIPQSVTVVTERLIDDRNLDTLKDALHNTAGISFLAAEGGEEDIRLRGYSLQSTGDIFVDGMRDPAFYERDSFNWDRLEVLRGSASMLFGRGSTGGAVNQASKGPLLFGRNEVSVTAGSGDYLRGTADLNFRLGENAALRVNAMRTQAENWGNRIDKEGLALAAGFGIGTRDEFGISVYHLRNDNGIHYGLPWLLPSTGSTDRVLVPADPRNYYGAASDYARSGVDLVTLSHIHRFGAGSELKTALRAGTYSRDQRASAIRFAAANLQPGGQAVTAQTISDATVLTRGANNKAMDMDTLYLQSDYSGKFQALGFKHSLQAGVDLAHEQFKNFGFGLPAGVTIPKPATTLGTPNDGGSVDESRRILTVNRTFDAKALGLYAQDLLQVAPDWKLLAGLRWDRFDGSYSSPQITNANGSITAATRRARSDALWSKRLGLLWQPSAFQSYHLSWGTSFNTSGDSYQYDALGSNTPPESSENLELGAKLDLYDGNLSVRSALFYAVKKNERNRDADTVNATNYVLSGQRHAAGFELDIAGRITPAWEVFASYSFIPDARIDKGAEQVNAGGVVTCADCSLQGEPVGSRPGLIPRHSGTVWTTYQLTTNWRFGGGLNARSSMLPYQITTFTAPSYVTADLMAEYTLGDMSFKANLNNVGNKLTADMLYRGHYIPGKGRQLQVTGTWKF